MSKNDGIKNLKKSVFINPKTHILGIFLQTYAETDNLPLANYATAKSII